MEVMEVILSRRHHFHYYYHYYHFHHFSILFYKNMFFLRLINIFLKVYVFNGRIKNFQIDYLLISLPTKAPV